MATIVYEGLPGNGDLFAGKKFFIIQRVPIRNTLIQYVEVGKPQRFVDVNILIYYRAMVEKLSLLKSKPT